MSDIFELDANIRAEVGKKSARNFRNNNLVPAIIYGNKQEPEKITVNFNELLKNMNKGNFKRGIINLNVDGKTQKVKAKEIQLHPVKHIPRHVDFIRVVA